jgi:two-component system OmpR family response regulator
MTSNRESDFFDRSIDNQVSRLRKKIEDDPKKPEFIKTIWGGGYMLTADTVRT